MSDTDALTLTRDEIKRITGYSQPKRQVQWFTERGYRAVLNARNACIVFRADIENRQPERPKLRLLHAAA